jgi:hypothetical protein
MHGFLLKEFDVYWVGVVEQSRHILFYQKTTYQMDIFGAQKNILVHKKLSLWEPTKYKDIISSKLRIRTFYIFQKSKKLLGFGCKRWIFLMRWNTIW